MPLVLTLGCASAGATGAPAAGSATVRPPLFDRLGGKPAIAAVVDDLLARAAKDARINAKLKNARHNSGVKSRSKPLGRPSKGKRNRQGRHRSGLARSSKHRSAPAWSSSVERPNRNALARPMNNSVPTSAGELMSNGA